MCSLGIKTRLVSSSITNHIWSLYNIGSSWSAEAIESSGDLRMSFRMWYIWETLTWHITYHIINLGICDALWALVIGDISHIGILTLRYVTYHIINLWCIVGTCDRWHFTYRHSDIKLCYISYHKLGNMWCIVGTCDRWQMVLREPQLVSPRDGTSKDFPTVFLDTLTCKKRNIQSTFTCEKICCYAIPSYEKIAKNANKCCSGCQ